MDASKAWTAPKKPKVCVGCGQPFMPRIGKQRWCYPCHKPCPDCGGPKDVRAVRCRDCDARFQRGIPRPGSRREPPTDAQVEQECLQLATAQPFAFGYVVGVTFGDGSVSKTAETVKHRCRDGSYTMHPIRGYTLRLSTTNRAFAENFATELRRLTGRPVKVGTFRRVITRSTLPSGRLGTLSGYNTGFRHRIIARYLYRLKREIGPRALFTLPAACRVGILCGLIDSEGYLAKKYVDIANTDVALLETAAELLSSVGIASRVYLSPSQKCAHLRFRRDSLGDWYQGHKLAARR